MYCHKIIWLGYSTLVREIFHIVCADPLLVFQAHSEGHILMGVFYLEYCGLRMPHQNYFTQRGLYQIVASCIHYGIATQHAQHSARRQFGS